jgi:hypothetical protein
VKRFLLVTALVLLGPGALATDTTPSTSEPTDSETLRLDRETYRSSALRAPARGFTYDINFRRPVRADEIEIRVLRGTFRVDQVLVEFANGGSRYMRELVGLYGRDRVGVRTRSGLLRNERNVVGLQVTVRGMGSRWSMDLFEIALGTNRGRPDDRFTTIEVLSAWYGQNVGAPRNNALRDMARQCDGRDTCVYTIDYTRYGGDPAYGIQKNFVYSYSCGGRASVRNERIVAEAHGKTIRINCSDRRWDD